MMSSFYNKQLTKKLNTKLHYSPPQLFSFSSCAHLSFSTFSSLILSPLPFPLLSFILTPPPLSPISHFLLTISFTLVLPISLSHSSFSRSSSFFFLFPSFPISFASFHFTVGSLVGLSKLMVPLIGCRACFLSPPV